MKPILHKLLLGEKAALYLPFGLAQLKKMERIYKRGFFSQKYFLGGYEIHIEQKGVFQYVRIRPTGGYFEFFTTGNPVETFVTTGTVVPFTGSKAAVVSAALASRTPGASIAGGAKEQFTIDTDPLGRQAQLGLIDEPVAYAGGQLIYDAYPPVSPHTGVWLRSFEGLNTWGTDVPPFPAPGAGATREPFFSRGSLSPFTLRDIDFDVPFQIGQGKAKAQLAYLRGDMDWPRANGVQTVVSTQHGTRAFGIYNDAFGQFGVFPLSAVAPLDGYNQNVPAGSVVVVKPELPAWVFVSAKTAQEQWDDEGAKGAAIFPDTDWKFSHDGTKACAVVFERREATFDSAYYAVDQGATVVDSTVFDRYRRHYTGALAKFGATWADSEASSAYRTRYSVAPGVVEILFTITLTGANPEDFTVATEVREVRRPTTAEYFTVLAGYSWVDIKATDWTVENDHYDAKKGDMVTLDLEIHYRHFGAPVKNAVYLLSLKNHTAPRAAEIFDFPAEQFFQTSASGTPSTEASRLAVDGVYLVDYDLPTLSFVLRIEKTFTDVRVVPGVTVSPAAKNATFFTTHFGLSVYTLNRYRETLYPETIDAFAKTELDYRKNTRGRAAVEASPNTLLPLHRLTNWSDPGYAGYRNWRMEAYGAKSFGSPAPTPSAEVQHTFDVGFLGFYVGPMLVTDPCLAWNAYGTRLVNLLHTTENSVFFVHPQGTWAFYDQQYVYNKHGVPNVWAGGVSQIQRDTYTGVDLTKFEHCIFDRISVTPVGRDATFRGLYNRAVARGSAAGSLVADLQPIELSDLRAVFTKHAITVGTATAAMLGVTWGGVTGYYLEGAYVTATGFVDPSPFGDLAGSAALSLGDYFYAAAAGTGRVDFSVDAHPIKFSSAVLV